MRADRQANEETTKQIAYDERTGIKVVSTTKVVRGREHCTSRVILNRKPKYLLEPTEDGCYFLRKSDTNEIVGLLNNGRLEDLGEQADKMFYFSRLCLKPKNPTLTTDQV